MNPVRRDNAILDVGRGLDCWADRASMPLMTRVILQLCKWNMIDVLGYYNA